MSVVGIIIRLLYMLYIYYRILVLRFTYLVSYKNKKYVLHVKLLLLLLL